MHACMHECQKDELGMKVKKDDVPTAIGLLVKKFESIDY